MDSVPHRASRNLFFPIAAAIVAVLQTACGASPLAGDELGVDEQRASVAGASCSAPQLTVAVNGSVATLSATSTCGSTPEYRFLIQAPGQPSYAEVAPYSTVGTTSVDAASLGQAGRYSAMVQVRELGAAERDAYAYDAFFVGDVCTGATLSATAGANGRIELAASARCPAAAEYRFLVRAPGATTYVELRGYEQSSTLSWDVSNLAVAGRYDLLVYARASGNLSSYEAYASAGATVGGVCTATTLTATPNGATTTLAASATCGGSAAEYRFLARAPGATGYTELRGWGAASYEWNTANVSVAGRYELLVYARRAGNRSSYETYASASTNVGSVCTAVTLSATPNGATTDLAASAACGGAAAEYRFLVRAPGATAFTELRGWGESTFAWDTAGVAEAGRYDLLVYARAAGNASAYEVYAITNTTVGRVCTAATLGVTANGSTRNLAANATCGGAAAEYRFVVRAPGATAFTELRGWGEASYGWDTSGLAEPGRYDLLVYARALGNPSAYEAYASSGVNVGEVCTSAALAATVGSGSTVNLAATATCGTATPEFRFYLRAPGATSYVELRGWGSSEHAWDFSNLPAGTYGFLTYARVAGHTSAYEAYATKTFVVSR